MTKRKRMIAHENQHEAVVWIEDCQKAKHLKKCGFLRIANYDRCHTMSDYFTIVNEAVYGNAFYYAACRKNAFKYEILKDKRGIPADFAVPECPINCRFYKPKWKMVIGAKLIACRNYALALFSSIISGIKWLVERFTALPATTQALAIFLGITSLGFSHIDELIKLLNAIKNW